MLWKVHLNTVEHSDLQRWQNSSHCNGCDILFVTSLTTSTKSQFATMGEIPSTRRNAIMVFLCVAKYFLKTSYSIISPFYPSVALGKGVDPMIVGFVLASFALVSFIVSPPLGKSIAKFGARFIFSLGCGIAGLSALLFGCLKVINNADYFVSLSFLVRTAQAVGVQAGNTAAIAIVFQLYRRDVAFAIGIFQIFSGLGLISGPTLGGLLYSAGGYLLPFLVLGGILLMVIPFFLCLYPDRIEEDIRRTEALCPLLVKIGIILGMLVRVVTAIEITFLDSTLGLALISLNINSATTVGILFLLAGLAFGISAPVWGLIGDKLKIFKELNLIGLILGAVGYLLIGPAPFLGLQPTFGVIATGLSIMGLGVGAIITIIPEMVDVALQKGYEDNLQTYGLVSGLYYFADNLGLFVGPIMGSALFTDFGFPLSCTDVSFMVAGTFVLYAFYVTCYRCCQCVEVYKIPDKDKETEDKFDDQEEETNIELNSQSYNSFNDYN
ncbi:MFS-type transporter SLC18B1-like [Ptychodera flava]|uniref:MFS-type transporter SLC18B1-like n=1 Tax=Ptychodera flava TaxID=63121 RepID=UPI00396A0EBF